MLLLSLHEKSSFEGVGKHFHWVGESLLNYFEGRNSHKAIAP